MEKQFVRLFIINCKCRVSFKAFCYPQIIYSVTIKDGESFRERVREIILFSFLRQIYLTAQTFKVLTGISKILLSFMLFNNESNCRCKNENIIDRHTVPWKERGVNTTLVVYTSASGNFIR